MRQATQGPAEGHQSTATHCGGTCVSASDSPQSASKGTPGSGRKRELIKNLQRMIEGHCAEDAGLHDAAHALENRLLQELDVSNNGPLRKNI